MCQDLAEREGYSSIQAWFRALLNDHPHKLGLDEYHYYEGQRISFQTTAKNWRAVQRKAAKAGFKWVSEFTHSIVKAGVDAAKERHGVSGPDFILDDVVRMVER